MEDLQDLVKWKENKQRWGGVTWTKQGQKNQIVAEEYIKHSSRPCTSNPDTQQREKQERQNQYDRNRTIVSEYASVTWGTGESLISGILNLTVDDHGHIGDLGHQESLFILEHLYPTEFKEAADRNRECPADAARRHKHDLQERP